MDNLARMKAIYGQFDKDREIPESEYVDFDLVRGESVLAPLRQRFIFAREGETCSQLFAGGRGSGKTTELKRFQQRLKEAGFTALYIDVEDTIDVNSCGFGDYLFAIAYGVRAAVEDGDVQGDSSLKQYVRSKVEEIRGLFGARLRVPGIELSAGLGGLEAKSAIGFERPPSSKAALSEELEAIASDATHGVREMLTRLHKTVQGQGRHGLVLLVDGADKISPYPPSDANTEQHVRIFAQRATYLTRLGCHVVYSAPLSFCYSPDAQTFTRTAGVEAPIVLPNTSLDSKVTTADGSEVTGRDLFREMVAKRMTAIGEDPVKVFSDEALELAINESGGNPDALNTIVQSAIVRMPGGPPIQADSVERAVKEMANGMAMQIPDAWWSVLKELKKRDRYPNKSEEAFRMGLYYHYIYQYANGEPQFEVNPVLRRLQGLDG
ncbi:MAG: ATP-binding protein [Fimbriimonadaceae bacterium]|nr:ATP-binding protein [Fimbriimonadaceae bacterium]